MPSRLSSSLSSLSSMSGNSRRYNAVQIRLKRIEESPRFEGFLCGTIMLNLILIVIEADSDAVGDTPPAFVSATTLILLVFYTLELCVRLYIHGTHFFRCPWCWLDFMVVFVDVIFALLAAVLGDAFPSMSMMRLLRLMRLARSRVIIQFFPDLNMQVACLIGSLKSLFWGGVIVSFTLILWSVLAVQMIHPLNKRIEYGDCSRCPRAFESVGESMLTFSQQILAGDSWGQVTVPIISEHPLTALFFLSVFVSLDMALLNVVLAAIVDSANQARAENTELMAELKEGGRRKAEKHMLKLFREMDGDCSGHLSKDEVFKGWEENHEFQATLREMDIDERDLITVWDILDEDKSGTINYAEFAQQLYKMKQTDSHTMLMFIKHYICEMRQKVNAEFALVSGQTIDQISSIYEDQTSMVRKIYEVLGKETELMAATDAITNEISKMEVLEKEVLSKETELMAATEAKALETSKMEVDVMAAKSGIVLPQLGVKEELKTEQPQVLKETLRFVMDLEIQINSLISSLPQSVVAECSSSNGETVGQPLNAEQRERRSWPPESIQRQSYTPRTPSAWPGLPCGGCQMPKTLVIPMITQQLDSPQNTQSR